MQQNKQGLGKNGGGSIFRDFVLVESSHLGPLEDVNNLQQATARVREIQRRMELAKRAIDIETKPGDLLLVEKPYEYTFEDFLKTSRLLKKPRNECGTLFLGII